MDGRLRDQRHRPPLSGYLRQVSRIAVISDVHGNLPALKAVLAAIEIERVSTIWCLGDTVGMGEDQLACFEIVDQVAEINLSGNHEWGLDGRASLRQFAGVPAALEALRRGQQQFKSRPDLLDKMVCLNPYIALEMGAKTVLAIHASPVSAIWHFASGTAECWQALSKAPWADLIVCGHTHQPAFAYLDANNKIHYSGKEVDRADGVVFGSGERWLVNPGSVGRPERADRKAEWGILTLDEDHEPLRFDWRRTAV